MQCVFGGGHAHIGVSGLVGTIFPPSLFNTTLYKKKKNPKENSVASLQPSQKSAILAAYTVRTTAAVTVDRLVKPSLVFIDSISL